MFNTIVEMLQDYVETPAADITPETKFIADLGMSSLDIMTMIGDLEDKFSITIETEDLEDLSTVGDLVKYLESR